MESLKALLGELWYSATSSKNRLNNSNLTTKTAPRIVLTAFWGSAVASYLISVVPATFFFNKVYTVKVRDWIWNGTTCWISSFNMRIRYVNFINAV